jgi:hypothetical protein
MVAESWTPSQRRQAGRDGTTGAATFVAILLMWLFGMCDVPAHVNQAMTGLIIFACHRLIPGL